MADLNKAVCLAPKHTAIYLARGYIYYEIGDSDKAIEDYDNAVRLCPNYKTDLVDRKHIVAGLDMVSSVEKAVELLDSVVEDYDCSENFASAAYYSGVSILFSGNKHKARQRFETARELGFKDDTKIAEHLENLKDRK
ncbi:MAG: tetratricopeptide repeat protein [Candidatus Poribacteria bacterium]|nr:tetratricopeptide repeat protein [Candidatus Poribacteria bacterium]